jgi:hypothetical protein
LPLPDTILTTADLPRYANATVKSNRPPPLPITPIILGIVVFIVEQQTQIVIVIVSAPPPFSLAQDWREDTLNQYDGALDGKMKNIAICSRMLRLTPTIMVSTVQSLHRPSSGC